MRKAIAAVGLAVAAVASGTVAAAPASAATVRPNLVQWEFINNYWNYAGGPDALTTCRAQGNRDTASGNPFQFECNPIERTLRNGTFETGFALYEDFLIG